MKMMTSEIMAMPKHFLYLLSLINQQIEDSNFSFYQFIYNTGFYNDSNKFFHLRIFKVHSHSEICKGAGGLLVSIKSSCSSSES